MIKYLSRNQLDVKKYDTCILNSLNSKVYAYSWYLDSVADNWDVLILNDYEAVMPLPWRKKYFIKYVYTPFWMLELGIFYTDTKINYNDFFKEAFKKFKFLEIRLNTENNIENIAAKAEKRKFQVLPLYKDYDKVRLAYRKDRLKDLKKAKNAELIEVWNDDVEKLITLFKQNVGKRTPNITEKDYKILYNLIKTCIKNDKGDVLSIYQAENIVASAFFLRHKKTVTILLSSTDFSNRNNGANTFLIDRAMFKYKDDFSEFNFGGSSITSIANYFNSFGATSKVYYLLKNNSLPLLIQLLKR